MTRKPGSIDLSAFCADKTVSVAIVAPSPVPFTVGGAEKLWWGLQEYINRNTAHHCELFKMCILHEAFFELLSDYDRFYRLDLGHFDRVLTTCYPAWMVRHPDHRIYFQHPLRSLYDRYQGPGRLSDAARRHPVVRRILDYASADSPDPRRLIGMSMELCCDPLAPEEVLSLHNPLSLRVVRALDRQALVRAVRVFSISKTVRDRPGYFPDPAAVPVVYHPSNLEALHDAAGNYFFTVSRMVSAKRLDLVINAYRSAHRAGVGIPLVVAGRGPELAGIRKMAESNEDIFFTGFVSDRDLARLYARALAVIFVPENEDLGMVALEAMASGKPVITCSDSGGPAELIDSGITGWVCHPNVSSLSAAMNEAGGNPKKAFRMGRRARDFARLVTWKRVFSLLFASEET